jgi:asparagine N-glycosylation enzyme membrane subunit Stt3
MGHDLGGQREGLAFAGASLPSGHLRRAARQGTGQESPSLLVSRLAHGGLGPVGVDIGSTSRFLYLFTIESALCLHRSQVASTFQRLPIALKLAVSVAGLVLLDYGGLFPTAAAANTIPQIGALALFVVAIASPPVTQILSESTLVRVGRVFEAVWKKEDRVTSGRRTYV